MIINDIRDYVAKGGVLNTWVGVIVLPNRKVYSQGRSLDELTVSVARRCHMLWGSQDGLDHKTDPEGYIAEFKRLHPSAQVIMRRVRIEKG